MHSDRIRRLRAAHIAVSVAAVVLVGATATLAADPAAGLAINGLKLTLAAEKTQLKMTAPGKVEPTKLKLTFTNVGTRPIKLNAWDLYWRHIRLDVTGPDAGSVRTSRIMVKRRMRAPGPADFPTLKPGATWSPRVPLAFPGIVAGQKYTLMKRGEYRLTVTYAMTPQRLWPRNLAAGSWTGEVVSNEVVLKYGTPAAARPAVPAPIESVIPAPIGGKAVRGLQLTISAKKTELTMPPQAANRPPRRGGLAFAAPAVNVRPVPITVTFTNTGKTPIKLNVYDFMWRKLSAAVKGPDADSVRVTPLMRAMVFIEPAPKDFPTLAPGKCRTVIAAFPGPCGGKQLTPVKPGKYTLTLTYTCSDIEQKLSPLAKGAWTGKVVSNELVFTAAKSAK